MYPPEHIYATIFIFIFIYILKLDFIATVVTTNSEFGLENRLHVKNKNATVSPSLTKL
jgi:hypothetical protein